MTDHSLDPYVAIEHGTVGGILFSYLKKYCNETDSGWILCTEDELLRVFPYLLSFRVRYALHVMIESGLIERSDKETGGAVYVHRVSLDTYERLKNKHRDSIDQFMLSEERD